MQNEKSLAVKAGIFVLVCGLIMIAGIVVLGQRTLLFQQRYEVLATFEDAGGLIRGASVRIAGVTAGSVGKIEVIQGPEGKGAVEVALEINRHYSDMIRMGSVASIRTLGALGDKYVEISPGPSEAPPLRLGSHIATSEGADFYEIAEEVRSTFSRANTIAQHLVETMKTLDEAEFAKNVHAAANSLAQFLKAVEEGPSLVHSVVYDDKLPQALDDLKYCAQVFRNAAERVEQGRGAVGGLLYSDEYRKALDDVAAASVELREIIHGIRDGEGLASAVIYDENGKKTLTAIQEAASNIQTAFARINSGEGTLGLLVADPTVWESIKRVLDSAEQSRLLKIFVKRSVEKRKEEERGNAGKE